VRPVANQSGIAKILASGESACPAVSAKDLDDGLSAVSPFSLVVRGAGRWNQLHAMPLSAGTLLGPYEILSAIGAGGIGELYQCSLPRAGHEAREHRPHIDGLEESNGARALVMELVEGEDLARSPRRYPSRSRWLTRWKRRTITASSSAT
jgi:hypothetical protein